MNSAAAKSSSTTPSQSSKRLFFDRRYGWVLDEWKEPSQEALSGGRGMFCIVPLAKALLNKASETINVVTSATLEVFERPDLLSPKVVQANLTHQLSRTASSLKQTGLALMAPKKSYSYESTSLPSDLIEEESLATDIK